MRCDACSNLALGAAVGYGYGDPSSDGYAPAGYYASPFGDGRGYYGRGYYGY